MIWKLVLVSILQLVIILSIMKVIIPLLCLMLNTKECGVTNCIIKL